MSKISSKRTTLKGCAAFVGVWVAMCAIGELVLGIRSFGYSMAWGVVSFVVASYAERWINGELTQAAEV